MKRISMVMMMQVLVGVIPAMLTLDVAAQSSPTTKQVLLHITGMETPQCPVILKKALAKTAGVIQVDADLERHSATIVYDSHQTNVGVIRRIIKNRAGFESRQIN